MADNTTEAKDHSPGSEPQLRVEVHDSLPGNRAIIAIDDGNDTTWLVSTKHFSEQAGEELASLLCVIQGVALPYPR